MIAHGKVRYYGEPIAVVVRHTRNWPRSALAGDGREFEPLAAVDHWASAKQGKVPAVETIDRRYRLATARLTRAIPTRRSGKPMSSSATSSVPHARRPCRWKRAACWPNGMASARACRVSGAQAAVALQPQGDGENNEIFPMRRSIVPKSTSAAASVRAVNSIRKTISSPSRRPHSAIR